MRKWTLSASVFGLLFLASCATASRSRTPASITTGLISDPSGRYWMTSTSCDDAGLVYTTQFGNASVETLKNSKDVHYQISQNSKVSCKDATREGSAACECRCESGFDAFTNALFDRDGKELSKNPIFVSCEKIESAQ